MLLNMLKTYSSVRSDVPCCKDDYYLQNLLCRKLEKMDYVKTDEWDEF